MQDSFYRINFYTEGYYLLQIFYIISLDTRLPDYIAPSIYPIEDSAVSVPAQCIRPSGYRKEKLPTPVKVPGEYTPAYPPPTETS